jgi:ketosteroid isomerase-like protein
MREEQMHAQSSVEGLDAIIEQYHAAVGLIVRGDPEPLKALYSHADDVVLANPFGPAVRGWREVSARLEDASSRMSDGEMAGHDRLAGYVTNELATIHEVEHGTVSVGGGAVAGWTLRTTTTFRREDGAWKVVHRHADPISTTDVQGPLRTT